ncbi:YafY family protein [Fodinicola feengrottensis]|uniref:YafY family protein n=1 Tax=Fodinicola feengrottensis TaxID=435914 RepID=A0ABN2JA49_9ACTN
MWDTAGRLLRVLELLQQRHEWGAAELAERLGVSTRTIRRDVDRLRAIGYPVDARYGADGGYHLAPGANLPPLMFDADEAVATVLALQEFNVSGAELVSGSAVRALTKLAAVMPRRLRGQVEALVCQVRHTPHGTMRGQRPTPVAVETLIAVAVACRERRRATAAYDGADCLLDPLSLVRAGQRWYVVAWEVNLAQWRTLRVDELTDFTATDRPAADREPPSPDLEAYVVEHLAIQTQQVHATVRVEAPVAAIEMWIDPAWGWIEPVGDTACVLHVGADSLASVARWLLLLNAELTIVEPAELATEYRNLAAVALRAADSFSP